MIPAASGDTCAWARRRCDALAHDFIDFGREAAEQGAREARGEMDALRGLASAIVAAVDGWGRAVAPLDLGGGGFDGARARALILEAVFDEVLSPPAWRLLSAAVELAAEDRR